jgi:hypothetical protein
MMYLGRMGRMVGRTGRMVERMGRTGRMVERMVLEQQVLQN